MDLCLERYGQELNPIPTEALLQLLEEQTHDADQTVVLPDGMNGVTEYCWDRKPTVKIDARLTQRHWRESRANDSVPRQRSRRLLNSANAPAPGTVAYPTTQQIAPHESKHKHAQTAVRLGCSSEKNAAAGR